MKKLLSIILALTFVLTSFSSFTAFAVEETSENVYVVATDYEEIFGSNWQKSPDGNNVMTKEDGIYTLTVDNVQPSYQTFRFTVVKNTPNGRQTTYGYSFHGSKDYYVYYRIFETTSITFTFNPETKEIDVIGDGVRRVTGIDSVRAYGANTDALVHGEQDLFHYKGEMTKGEDGVYSVTFKDVEPTENIIIDVDNDFYFNEQIVGFCGYNYCAIDVVKKCDVTVYFDDFIPDSNINIWATGDGVVVRTKPVIGDLYVSGAFSGYWCTDINRMVEVYDNVYSVTIQNVSGENKQYFSFYNETEKFKEMWYHFFYGDLAEMGFYYSADMFPLTLNPTSIVFMAPYKNSNVTITLDLTYFDYATKQGAMFKIDATDMRGDLNVDGKVSITDATDVQKGLAEFFDFTDNQKISADVNGDGEVNIVDVTVMQKYVARIIESFDNLG